MPDRERVYEVLDGERDYQDDQKLDDDTWRDGQTVEQSPGDFVAYMHIYLGHFHKAVHDGGTEMDQMRIIRKVTALGVAAMEKFGSYTRETD